jgi:hypothetical protein
VRPGPTNESLQSWSRLDDGWWTGSDGSQAVFHTRELENFVEGRMHVLDIPEHQIGSSDHKHGVAWRTFFPHEGNGGRDGGAVYSVGPGANCAA